MSSEGPALKNCESIMSSSERPALKNCGMEAEIPEDQALLSFTDLKLLVQNETSSLKNQISVLEREMALLKLDMAQLKIARPDVVARPDVADPQALAMKPRVLQLLELQSQKSNVEAELSEKKEEAELSEKKEEAELSEKKEEAKHEAKKRELLLAVEKKRSCKEGEPSTWLVEGWSSEP